MIKEVKFWDRMRASEHIFGPLDRVISITDPNKSQPLLQGAEGVLREQFFDVVEPVATGGIIMEPMCEFQAARIFEQIKEWEAAKVDYTIIVHCEAGASRSGAIALFVFTYTLCYFPTIGSAIYANKYMLDMFEKVSGLSMGDALEVAKLDGGIH